MNRFKVVCIGLAVLIAAMVMCSCTAKVSAETYQSGYKVTTLYSDFSSKIVRVDTPSKSYTIVVFHKSGSIILN